MSKTATCCFSVGTKRCSQGRCHHCPFNHPASSNGSIVSPSLLYNKTKWSSGNRGTFSHNAPCSLTYWHNKILAAAQWCSRCVCVCADTKHFCFSPSPFKELLAAGIHSSSFYLSELPSSLSSPPPFSHYVKLLWHCSTWASGVKIFLLNDKWTCG